MATFKQASLSLLDKEGKEKLQEVLCGSYTHCSGQRRVSGLKLSLFAPTALPRKVVDFVFCYRHYLSYMQLY